MAKTIYLNLEDDVAKVVSKLKREKTPDVVLVFPKKSFIFADSINLRLLKKQLDMQGKRAAILTMDEVGQMYAKEAGFELRFLPKGPISRGFGDIRTMPVHRAPEPAIQEEDEPEEEPEPIPTPQPVRRKVAQVPVPTMPRRIVRRPVMSSSSKMIPPTMDAAMVIPSKKSHRDDSHRILPRLEKPPVEASRRRVPRKALIGFVAISLILAIVLTLFVLPRAELTVYAKSQVISRDIDMNLDTKATIVDAAKLTMPATPVDELADQSETFQTTGKKEVGSKAAGRVVIYNLTGSPINLKSTTTVLSVGSKNYTFNEDQNTIKALASPNDDAGATLADITAQQGGESFNLPAGTRMEITNQSFGSQPQRLYAKTASQVVGGSSRFISVISAEDIKKAQDSLNESAVDGIRKRLEGDKLTILKDAYIATPSEFAADKTEGTETPSFNAHTKVRIAGLAFNQEDLIKLLRERLSMSLGSNKSLQDVALDSITLKVKNVDAASGILALSVHYESKAIPKIDTEGIRQQVAGKSKQEATELLLSNQDIDHIDLKLSPSWQGSLPRFSGKVNIQLK